MWHHFLDSAVDRLRGTPVEPALPDEEGVFPLGTAAAVAVGAVVVVGVLGFLAPSPRQPAIDRWYDRLDKPKATPPDAVFGLVWPVLEVCLGLAAFRLLRQPTSLWRNRALGILAVNFSTIPTFGKIFFGQKDLQGAEVNTLAQAVGAWSFVATAWHADRIAALAALPHAAWTTFATWIMGEVVRRNDRQAIRVHRKSDREADRIERRLRRAV